MHKIVRFLLIGLRIPFAVIVSSAVAPLGFYLAFLIAGIFSVKTESSPMNVVTIHAEGVFFIGSMVAFYHAVVLGLPTYFLLYRFKLVKWWVMMLAGFFIGFIPLGCYVLFNDNKNPFTHELVWIFGTGGLVAGLPAWLILRDWPFLKKVN